MPSTSNPPGMFENPQHSTAMPRPNPPRNAYFQTALRDPLAKSTSHLTRPYRSATPSKPAPKPTGDLTLIIGPDPSTQRTWTLPKALLIQHSTLIAAHMTSNPPSPTLSLPSITPTDFANFASYMHSSIYSLNEQVSNFRAIRHNTRAALLGITLGCTAYTHAAVRRLHMLLEPLARLRTSNARKSPIRASDVDFVCEHTLPASRMLDASTHARTAAVGLRELFFEAVAAHWTQYEIMTIGPRMDVPGDTARWADVYNSYADFRAVLARALVLGDREGRVLRDVWEYLGKSGGAESAGVHDVLRDEEVEVVSETESEGSKDSPGGVPVVQSMRGLDITQQAGGIVLNGDEEIEEWEDEIDW